MKKNFFIRVDGSSDIGTGHIIRCLAIAEILKNTFDKITFLTKSSAGTLINIIKNKGFDVIILKSDNVSSVENTSNFDIEIKIIKTHLKSSKNDLNFLLIDHYELDINYESNLRDTFKRIFVIDDLANRKHDCDLLIDQNYYENFSSRYTNLIPKNTIKLLGPKYAILRLEFINSKKLTQKNFEPKKILISYGGSDPTNECKKILLAISSLKTREFHVTAVAGIHNKNFESLKKEFSSYENIEIFQHIDNFSKLLSNTDLCFGAGGTTTWERMYFGIPSFVTIISQDQKESVEFLSKTGHIINLGFSENMTHKEYLKCLERINPKVLEKMSLKNQKLIDGNGTNRIKKQIMDLVNDKQ